MKPEVTAANCDWLPPLYVSVVGVATTVAPAGVTVNKPLTDSAVLRLLTPVTVRLLLVRV